MYYYHFGDFHVVGASPEILVCQEQMPRAAAAATGRPEQVLSLAYKLTPGSCFLEGLISPKTKRPRTNYCSGPLKS